MTRDPIDVCVQWCKFTDGGYAYAYTLRVNGKYMPCGFQRFPTIHAAMVDAASKIPNGS